MTRFSKRPIGPCIIRWWSGVALLLLALSLHAQSAHQLLRSGDEAYDMADYNTAEEAYRKAIEEKPDTKGQFNLGNAIYQQERFEEAVDHYTAAAQRAKTPKAKHDAWHNLGNAHFQLQAYDQSVDAYKQAVLADPQDEDTKKNLLMAKQMLRQMQEQQQQQQSSQDQQQEEEESEEQQEQPSDGDQEQQQQQQSQADQGEEENESEASEAEEELSKEDALRLLEIIESEEKKVQEKLRRISANPKKPKKDW